MAIIAGNAQEKGAPAKPPKLPALQNPFNLNIPGLRANDSHGSIIGQPSRAPAAAPAAAAPAAAVAAPAAVPIDFNAETLIDPEYTQGKALLARQNTMNLKTLKDSWLRQGQSSQDSFNAHGGLFSGAAANAQRSNDQDYEGAQAQQALDFDQGGGGLYWSVFNRLKARVTAATGTGAS